MIATFLISLPVFLIILAGWLMRKTGIVNENWVRILNSFAYYVSLPALIITSFWGIDFLSEESRNSILLGIFTIILVFFVIFIFLSFFKINKNKKIAILLSALAGNTIYMGFPLVELGFGKDYISAGALIGVIYLIVPLLISIFIIRYWHDKEHKILRNLIKFLKNPLVISVFIGVILSFVKIEFPLLEGVKKSLIMLGATASPVALFSLGGFIYGRFLKKDLSQVLFISFLKMIVAPLVVFSGALFIFSINGFGSQPDGFAHLGILILLSSMPVAITTFVIAEKFNLDKDLIGNSIIVSTIFSFIIAPIIIFIF